jgi:hypothetical protein
MCRWGVVSLDDGFVAVLAMPLPLRRLTLFQHGLGFFSRSGETEAEFTLDVPRYAMDDVLKSLTVVVSTGTVRSVAFETPADRNPSMRRQPLQLDADTPLSSMIDAFTGRSVVVSVRSEPSTRVGSSGERSESEGPEPFRRVVGQLIGLEREEEDHLKRGLLAVLSDVGVELINVTAIERITLTDADAMSDLSFALEERRRNTDRAQARVSLSGPGHVDVSYTAPAPSWRVSYRVLIDDVESNAGGITDPTDATTDRSQSAQRRVLLQGWGLFDNTLDEDLENVELTLTAGMPVSFRYGLHEPNTPDRPIVGDDRRVLAESYSFDMMEAAPASAMMAGAAPAPMAMKAFARSRAIETADVAASAPVQAAGESRGTLFAYRLSDPVSIRRGESGMVPIVEVRSDAQRDLLYNRNKTPDHPSATVRFRIGDEVLERGPATVLENGNYSGEAVVPFTTSGGEVVLGFALELGVTVTPSFATRTETRAIRISDGSLIVGVVDVHDCTYRVDSKLNRASVVTVEHPLMDGAVLLTQPNECDAQHARFRGDIGPNAIVELVVTEQVQRSYYENIRGIDGIALQKYLADQLIDKSTYDALAHVMKLQAELTDLEQARSTREDQRDNVRERLNDVRSNLASLDANRDGPLRDRFVLQLEELETKLAALDVADDAGAAQADSLDAQISFALQQLTT